MEAKRAIAIGMICLQMMSSSTYIYAYDEVALLEKSENEYVGSNEAGNILKTIGFSDVENGNWAKQSIARAGALSLIKGFENKFYPTQGVSRAESLALMIRLLGRGAEAELLTRTITKNWDKNVNMKDLWAVGYMSIASGLGFIEAIDYTDALYPRQEELDKTQNFIMGDVATREELAEWVSKLLEIIAPNDITYTYTYSEIYKYNDWQKIDNDKRRYVDLVSKYDIMTGTDIGFEPKKGVTRAEMAKIIENLDDFYYKSVGLTKKMGYVAEIEKDIYQENDEDVRGRFTYIRSANGKIDRLFTLSSKNNIDQVTRNEVIVYKKGKVATSSMLEKGDTVEYLVNKDNQIIYINVSNDDEYKMIGALYSLGDVKNGVLKIKLNDGRYYDGILKNLVYDEDKDSLLIGGIYYPLNKLPMSTYYEFTVKGNVVTKIEPHGEEEIFEEIRGVVKNVDTINNTITIYDSNKNLITKRYDVDTLVEKKEYYETTDEVGYIDEVFKEYMFDKLDSDLRSIEIGDTVFFRFRNDGVISNIDVGTNYGVKYGKVKKIDYRGIEGSKIIIEFENEGEEILDIADDAIFRKSDRKVSLSDLVIGDWVKILYNRGIVNSSTVIETIKQVNISGVEEQIREIYKGELSYIDKYQNKLSFVDVEKLTPIGWRNYEAIKNFEISADILYFDGSKRVSLDYMNEFLMNYGTAYIAVAENFGREEIVKITFRNSRETVLEQDNVNYAKGNGEFKLTYDPSSIVADEGTIIRRYGRLVDGESIFSPDLAKVVLNGQRTAAVVDIKPEISNEEMSIFRGKIKSVNEGNGFQVYSFSKLQDMEWSYMALERNFVINNKTKIYKDGTEIKYYDFLDYTDTTQIDNIYTIFAIGDEAVVLSDMPYIKRGINGTVYKIDNETLGLKDVVSYNLAEREWEEISNVDKTMNASILSSSIIIKDGKIVESNEIEVGNKLRIMGAEDGLTLKKSGSAYAGNIIFVER